MGVEGVASEIPQVPVETVTEVDNAFKHEKVNGKVDEAPGFNEPIKFGSHGDEPVTVEEGSDSNFSNFPKDAVDEWPEPEKIYSFYCVKYRLYDDPTIKAKIDQADKEIHRRNLARFQLTDELKAKRADRSELTAELNSLRVEDGQFKSILDERKKEIKPLHQALGKLRDTNSAGRSGGICSSEKELNDLIYSLQYRIQHESIPLSEEKQILREIKQLEGTRDKVIANAAMRAKIQGSMGQKESIQDQVKLMGVDMDGVRKEQQAVWSKINRLREKQKAIDGEINVLQGELKAVTEKRDKAYDTIQELRKQRDEANANFYQYRVFMNKVRDLAAKKDVHSLEFLVNEEVEQFMSLWNNNKAIRDDYEKRILLSLDQRVLSRDGRIRNPDEKPILVVEAPTPLEVEVAKPLVKRSKDETKSSTQADTLPSQKVQKEVDKKVTDSTSVLEHFNMADKGISAVEKLHKGHSSSANEIDETKLKEMKREAELAKAKHSMERKKKLAEKAAAKAAIKAQKEAEKKLKEREKKARKKAGASAPAPELEEPESAAEASEPEKAEVNVEVLVPAKEKVQKENTVRYRNRLRGSESLPKAILKRKKSTNYWIWAAPAALVVLIFLLLGYFYLL
ncbi:hypothetical protein CFOL_v3_15793 [Cephalotus follicularis]|uniref:Proton pump-interactor 1 n=1 Tax=Cephalotus follicularis TaxID=3775 RepID=A0A1Q3BWE3_CEPFO|nr:hypothetical protein CFOL_v3_15793 [Cephalotus follicularis]